MAYERSWQFMAVQGPTVPSGHKVNSARYLWSIKAMLLGQIGTAVSGLWTLVASCDGSTYGYDTTDRWTSSFNSSLIPGRDATNESGLPFGWCILTRQINGIGVWLTLLNQYDAGGQLGNVQMYLSGTVPTGGSTTVAPTVGAILGRYMINSSANAFNTDTTNGRRIYGAVSTLGDFWIAQTVQGEVEYGTMTMGAVGYKINDQYPVYFHHCTYIGGTSGGPWLGYSWVTFNASNLLGKFYNGGNGYPFIVPIPSYNFLDQADSSLFDFPAWIYVANSNSSPTQAHSRGRLPDCGIISSIIGQTAANSRPVNPGSTIKDASGTIRYITLSQIIVPYNALVS